MSNPVDTTADIRSFQFEIPQEQIDDLRRRVAAARWPTRARPRPIAGRAVGDDAGARPLLDEQRYDWRKCEARLSALPQFTTEIDGVEIHFIHVRSRHEGALPLIMTPNWPGSVVELLETIGPLTDPTAHGGNPEDAFDLVPSLPGCRRFSAEPTELGWDASRTARGRSSCTASATAATSPRAATWSALVTDLMGRQAVQGLVGYHLNLLTAVLAIGEHLPKDSEQGRRGRGVRHVQAGRLRLLPRDGGAATDDQLRPAGLTRRAGSPGCSTTTRTATTRSLAFVDGEPVGNLTRDTIVDNITLYWLTGTAASAARSYWEDARALAAALASGQPPPPVSVPVGYDVPRRDLGHPAQLSASGHGLAYFNEVDRGGHFAAWEEPQLFTEELRAAFKSLR